MFFFIVLAPSGRTRVKDIWKVSGERWRTCWIGQSGRETYKTIPATPDDGKSPRRKRESVLLKPTYATFAVSWADVPLPSGVM